MAIIKFNDTHSLIDYLCKEEVLGELKVNFSVVGMGGWELEFNFDYPDLEDHLNVRLFVEFSDCVWPVDEMDVEFENAEDFSVSGECEVTPDDEQILLLVEGLVKKYTSRNNVYAYIDFEEDGDSYELKNIKVNQFEIFDLDNDEKPILFDNDLKERILSGILDILSQTRSGIECIDSYEFSTGPDGRDFYYCEKGSPGFNDLPNFRDKSEFLLDTSLLGKL